jgi:glycosyltransferase involved in cell wall biosynthesis
MVSIVIPVHNTDPNWLEVAVNSMQAQTLKEIEIVLVDDASTNTSTIQMLDLLDKEEGVEVIRLEKNQGISGALNIGIENSKFDIIARMDSDDYSFPHRLKMQFDYLKENPEVDLVGANLQYLFWNGSEWAIDGETQHPQIITRELAKKSHWFLNHPTVMFRKKSVMEIGGYDTSLRGYAEDYELWIRMLKNNKQLRNLPDKLLLLRLNPKSLSKNFNPLNHQFLVKLQETL